MGFYLVVNGLVHSFCKWVRPRVLFSPNKGSKWIQKLCANQVQYGCQVGSKKDFKELYLGFLWDLKLFRVCGIKRVLKQIVSGPKKGSVCP